MLICLLLASTPHIHNSTHRNNGSLSIVAYPLHANTTDATLRCMLGRVGVLLYMQSHAHRPVSQLFAFIGIRCCYVVEVIHREQDLPANTFSSRCLA